MFTFQEEREIVSKKCTHFDQASVRHICNQLTGTEFNTVENVSVDCVNVGTIIIMYFR